MQASELAVLNAYDLCWTIYLTVKSYKCFHDMLRSPSGDRGQDLGTGLRWRQSCHQEDKVREMKGMLGQMKKGERKGSLEMFQPEGIPSAADTTHEEGGHRVSSGCVALQGKEAAFEGEHPGCSSSAEKSHIMSISDHLMMVYYIMITLRTSTEKFRRCLE